MEVGKQEHALQYNVTATDSLSDITEGIVPAQRVICSVKLDGTDYSIVIETQDEFARESINGWVEGDEGDELPEPILILPISGITAETLDRVLLNTPTELLIPFLVEQTPDNLDS